MEITDRACAEIDNNSAISSRCVSSKMTRIEANFSRLSQSSADRAEGLCIISGNRGQRPGSASLHFVTLRK